MGSHWGLSKAGWGEPSAIPCCPLAHCLVPNLCSRDCEEQWGNMISGLLFPGLAPHSLYDTRRMPSWGGGGGGWAVGGVALSGRRHHRHPALPRCYLLGNRSCYFVTLFLKSFLGGGGVLFNPPEEWGVREKDQFDQYNQSYIRRVPESCCTICLKPQASWESREDQGMLSPQGATRSGDQNKLR